MSRRRRRPVEPWRQRAFAQREAERAAAPAAPPALQPGASDRPDPEPETDAEIGPPVGMGPDLEPSGSGPERSIAELEPPASEPEPPTLAVRPVRPRPNEWVGPAPEVMAPPSERRRGPRFNLLTGTLLLSAIALVGGFLIVNLVLMPGLTRQGSEVRVPEVIGLSEREAERLLAAEDLRLSKISEQWSQDVPRGFISAQDPPSGGVVKRGRRISVIVSLGAQGTSVPLLDGSTVRQAEILLESAGLRRGRIAQVYTDDVGRDLVIATDPPSETLVEQETGVDLLVSLGPLPREYVLPDLTGKDVSAVARSLRDEGFAVSLREGGPRGRSDVVAAQDPPPGRRVAPRDSIILYYRP
jgi:serine/threonine-protein kinase